MPKVTRRRTLLFCLLLAAVSWGMVIAQVTRQPEPSSVPMSSVPMSSAQASSQAAIAPAPALSAASTVSQPAQQVAASTLSFAAGARDMEALAQDVVDRAHIPGMALVIVQDGQILTLRGFGVTDTVTREAITPHTVFRLASLSKAFAGTLTALLVRDGALRWDSRVDSELPAFKLGSLQDTQNLTVRDILSQRAGLVHNTYDRDLESDEPFEILVQRLAGAPMACAPGDCYAYQNIAFALIGDIVFTVTGDFYTHQVVKRIFQPLGMYDASYGRDGLESSPSWARPHLRGAGGWVPVRAKEAYYRIPAAAGVNVSPHDMAQWLLAQMGHRPDVLPEDLLAEIHTPLVPTPSELHGSAWRRARLSDAYYGIGWRIYNYAGHTLVFHGGAVQGFRSMIAMLPDRDIGAVVLWNSESPVPSGFMPTLLDRALGLPYEDWLGLDRLNESRAARGPHKARKARARRKHR